jgi:uncharacterized protein DUF397
VRARDVGDEAGGAGREWRKSSRSYGSGECVEVAASTGQRVDVRDSRSAHGAVLTFNCVQWNAFVAGVRSGGLGL